MDRQHKKSVGFDSERLKDLREAATKLSEELCRDRSLRWSVVTPRISVFKESVDEGKSLTNLDLTRLNRLRTTDSVSHHQKESLHQSSLDDSSVKHQLHMLEDRDEDSVEFTTCAMHAPGLTSLGNNPMVLEALVHLAKNIATNLQLPDTPRSYRRLSVPDVIMASMDWDSDDLSESDASGETLLHLGHLMEGRRWRKGHEECPSVGRKSEVRNANLVTGKILIIFGILLAAGPFIYCTLRLMFEQRSCIDVAEMDLAEDLFSLADQKLISNSLENQHLNVANVSLISISRSPAHCTRTYIESANMKLVENLLHEQLETHRESSALVSVNAVSIHNMVNNLRTTLRKNHRVVGTLDPGVVQEEHKEDHWESKALTVYRRFDSDADINDTSDVQHQFAVRAQFWGGAFARPLSQYSSSRYLFLKQKYTSCDTTTAHFTVAMTVP